MNRDELARKMRLRIEMCRNLAASTGDKQTAEALNAMADEGERDLRKLQSDTEWEI